MIGSLTGTIAEIRPLPPAGAEVEIDVGGVGYLTLVPGSLAGSVSVGSKVRVVTHLVVREDSMTIFGFTSNEQREMFRVLLGVTGVGPKLGLSILSALDVHELSRAVATGDLDVLTSIPGIGRRGAQRIVLELKERLSSALESASPAGDGRLGMLSEVREALTGLGYSPAEARDAIDRIEAGPDAKVEDLVRAALKELSRV